MRIFVVIALWFCVSAAFSADINFESSWFSPELIENNDSSCGELLLNVQRKFLSPMPFHVAFGVQGYGYAETGRILDWQVIGSATTGQIDAFGKTYYLDYLNHPGCGGACEVNQPLVSDRPFPQPRDHTYLESLAKQAPPATSYGYTLAKKANDEIYLFSVANTYEEKNQILIYKLASVGRWLPACKIAVAPLNVHQAAPVKQSNVSSSMTALQQAVDNLMGGAGACGSMSTHSRWHTNVKEALEEALYRPWAVVEQNVSPDADGSFENDMKYLKQWSLTGVMENRALMLFEVQLHETIKRLAGFYHQANGWPLEASTQIATAALKGAASQGVRFYMYDPRFAEGEEAMRDLILEMRDIDTIRSSQFDIELVDEGGDSILNVAIPYSDALDYLLQKGINPNTANGFGKTALMYAAQANQIDAAALLIKHNADTNAVTVRPADACYYTLQTFNMTPLHYAVRYGSPKLIRLLLDNGAKSFIKAENSRNYPKSEETPLDWLHRYTALDSPEKNPNIPRERVAEIAQWLQPPTPQLVAKLANSYVLKAEERYRNGALESAYRDIRLAVELQPDNPRALADLALIALKNDKLGESLQSSKTLIDSNAENKIKANAWFNQGLACEQNFAQNDNGHLYFDGDSYCDYGLLYPFTKAYEAEPTPARSNKLKALFEAHTVPSCKFTIGSASVRINFQAGYNPDRQNKHEELQTLYVVHDKAQAVTAEDLAWTTAYSGGSSQRVVPNKIASLDLGEKVMSVYTSSLATVQFPYKAWGQTCSNKDE